MKGIDQNFDEYFKVRYADSRSLAEEAFRIRYQVYVEEMGWEPPNETGMESDQYDSDSHICLLEHRRTGTFAGCVRLVIPAGDTPLPFEHHGIRCTRPEVLDPDCLERGTFGEISRLAVPSTFRRRKHERQRPFILDENSSITIFTEEEKRSFPNIAIGLYLASIATVEILNHTAVFVVMEPKLQRHLQRFGLPFAQLSEPFELRGTRGLFGLQQHELTRHMPPEILKLYELIKASVAPQLSM